MAQLVVRNIEADVKVRLQRRAKRLGRSMEDEVRHILRHAVVSEDRSVRKLGTRIAERFRHAGAELTIPELEGRAARAATFDDE